MKTSKHDDFEAKQSLRLHNIYVTGLKTSVQVGKYIGCLDLAYGDINHGSSRTRTYNTEYKKYKSSYLHAKIRDQYTLDSSIKVGRMFDFLGNGSLTPSIGYTYLLQKYKLKKASITHYSVTSDFNRSRIHDMHLSNKAKWVSPFIDVRLKKPLFHSLSLHVGYSFFFPVRYTNKMHHERIDVRNKISKHKIYGHLADISLHYALTNNLDVSFGSIISEFRGKNGASYLSTPYMKKKTTSIKKITRKTVEYLFSLSYSF